MDPKLIKKINDRREKGTLRSLSSFDGMVDFISNDYLGLAKADDVIKSSPGSTGSRLISGHRKEIDVIENKLADHFGFEASLCFNSGYDANVGIFSSVPQKNDIILYDEYIHASVRDGIRLSYARSFSFKHNDLSDLERLLKKFKGNTIYIAIEGLYSMGGDIADLSRIDQLASAYDACIILDEAHSVGVYGENCNGLLDGKVCKSVLIKLVTFGKAYGAHGACVLTSKAMKEYLMNFARSFIYTTALPLHSYELMLKRATSKLLAEREKLKANVHYFRKKIGVRNLLSDENSPIQMIEGSVDNLDRIEKEAAMNNLAIKVVYPPTVPEGKESIRICLHSFNTREEINQLLDILK